MNSDLTGKSDVPLSERVPFRLERDFPLSELTTFGVGGPADWVAFCTSVADIKAAVEFCCQRNLEYFVLGGGSNVLVADKGFRGMIIVVQLEEYHVADTLVKCGAGCSLHEIVEKTTAAGLAGLENLAGIAGTIGGAVVGNAGAYGTCIADILFDIELFSPTEGLYIDKNEALGFSYRHSRLKASDEIVLSARFKLKPDSAEKLSERVREVLTERWRKVPKDDVSAGCFFKNIEKQGAPHGKLAAGWLLEQIGAKGLVVGNAAVYRNHANILVNSGGATADEVRKLSYILKDKVKEKFGIELQEEVVLVGDFS